MLQIKKYGSLISVNYNLQFLLYSKNLNKKYKIKKSKNYLIFLRSPKHFNIGKQKITNLNYKVIKLKMNRIINCYFVYSTINFNFLYNIFKKKIETNTYLHCKSIKFIFKTKFSIKWLEL